MYIIKNKCGFPVPVNLPKGKSIHFGPFEEKKDIEDSVFDSPDMQSKIKAKLFSAISQTDISQDAEVPNDEKIIKRKIKKEEVNE